MQSKIIKNQIRCARCHDLIISAHRHDFRWCECGAVAVDGGNEYLKRCGDLKAIEELSVIEELSAAEYLVQRIKTKLRFTKGKAKPTEAATEAVRVCLRWTIIPAIMSRINNEHGYLAYDSRAAIERILYEELVGKEKE